jgi:hypothetical protein
MTTIMDVELSTLDHRPFAALLPSQKQAIIEHAVRDLPWSSAELVTFVTSSTKRTYVTVQLTLHRGGLNEFVTWLVAFNDEGPYFDSGHYGYVDVQAATRDMYDRAL